MSAADRIAAAANLPTPGDLPSRYTQRWTTGQVYDCADCGALIGDRDMHNQFHATIIERPF
jgi:hypothetical protein